MAAFLKYGLFLNTFLFIMKRYLLPFFALFSLAFFEACNPDEKEPTVALSTPANLVSSDVANAYVALSLKLTKETAGFTPPVAARAFGYFGLALYEAPGGGLTGNQILPAPGRHLRRNPAHAAAAPGLLCTQLVGTTPALLARRIRASSRPSAARPPRRADVPTGMVALHALASEMGRAVVLSLR